MNNERPKTIIIRRGVGLCYPLGPMLSGIILVSIGVLLILPQIGIDTTALWKFFWPVLLINVGSLLLWKGLRRRSTTRNSTRRKVE
ncbi:MAG: hypothetical protein HYX75_07265 [Acidobacteria bacterium]|nr:hypothetical protein [Acidobacteriota bacterium]